MKMRIHGNHQGVGRMRRKRWGGFIQKTPNCQAWERLSIIERFSIGGQANAGGFYLYCVELVTDVDCKIDRDYC